MTSTATRTSSCPLNNKQTCIFTSINRSFSLFSDLNLKWLKCLLWWINVCLFSSSLWFWKAESLGYNVKGLLSGKQVKTQNPIPNSARLQTTGAKDLLLSFSNNSRETLCCLDLLSYVFCVENRLEIISVLDSRFAWQVWNQTVQLHQMRKRWSPDAQTHKTRCSFELTNLKKKLQTLRIQQRVQLLSRINHISIHIKYIL